VDLAAAAVVSVAAVQAEAGNLMRTHRFIRELEHDRITRAIKEAEAKTSGQIRVFLQRGKFEEDALERAQEKFIQLGMHKTKERNAILILVAPRAQKFAVVGDEGVHQKCGEKFWQALVEKMRLHFLREEFTDALVEGIESAGELLARYFPKTGPSANELPDEIVEG
jgi:uncharacterized membrane protein